MELHIAVTFLIFVLTLNNILAFSVLRKHKKLARGWEAEARKLLAYINGMNK